MPNPNIAEAGRATRFESGNTAASGRRGYGMPGSLAYAMKRIGSQPYTDVIAASKSKKAFKKIFKKVPQAMDWLAIEIAIQMAEGNSKATRLYSRLVDGPVGIDPARKELEKIVKTTRKMSDEELWEIVKSYSQAVCEQQASDL